MAAVKARARPALAAAALAGALRAMAGVAEAQAPLTLDDAIREAHLANARLPLPAFEVSAADARRSAAAADRWLKVAVEGDFLYSPAGGYDPALTNLGDARLQAVARQPIYEGGALKAGLARAEAGVAAAKARYRIAEKDLDLEVRSRFAEFLAARAEREVRREAIGRLSNYRTSLKSRQAAGQATASDLLKTEVRLALEETSVFEAEEKLEAAQLSLNDLMGRDPGQPLEVAPLEPPGAPGPSPGSAWEGVPEIAAAQAEARSAEADVALAEAERRPHLSVNADLGLWGSDTTHLGSEFWDRLWRARGYSVSLVLAWPVWDTGAAKARRAEAAFGLQSARSRLEVERRDARLAWAQAQAAMRHLYRQFQGLSRAVPDARDSYLQTESLYRGGAASSLEVLDAHAAAVDAAVRLGEVAARYRIAQAVAIRWSTP